MAVFSIYLGAMGPLHDKNKIRPVDLIIGQADFGVPAQAGVVGKKTHSVVGLRSLFFEQRKRTYSTYFFRSTQMRLF